MQETNKKFYVYMILTVNNKLYCGYTDDVQRRYRLHCEGKGAKFTKADKPLKLVYVKEFESKREALKEEYRIKRLKRMQKEDLLSGFEVSSSLTTFAPHINPKVINCQTERKN